jgi:hypothetical protein
MRRASLLLLLLLVVLLPACQEPSVGLRVRFPSIESFLVTTSMQLTVLDGAGTGPQSPDAVCRALSLTSATPPDGVNTLASAGPKDPCEFRSGVKLDGIGVGRRVVYVEAQSNAVAVMRGCSVVDVFGDAADALSAEDKKLATSLDVNALIDVQLATLPTFPDAPQVTCQSVQDKCDGPVSKSCVQ